MPVKLFPGNLAKYVSLQPFIRTAHRSVFLVPYHFFFENSLIVLRKSILWMDSLLLSIINVNCKFIYLIDWHRKPYHQNQQKMSSLVYI